MALDPSIYNQVGRVNLGQGLSDILNQQRQREMQQVQQEQTLANIAQQRELGGFQLRDLQRKEAAIPQQQQQARSQELNMWLSNAVQSGRPQEEVMSEAIAKGQEIGVAPEVTQKHVMNVFASAQEPKARSDFAFTQAYPDLVAKQRAEAMFSKQGTQAAPSTVGKLMQERDAFPANDPRRAIYDAAIKKETERQDNQLVAIVGAGGAPVLVPRTQAVGMQPYAKPSAGKGVVTDEQKVQASLSAQQAIDQAFKLLNHPGRETATGASSFMSKLPGTDARGFAANLETFKAQTFIPMVAALKGMGALSDAEGKKIADSVGALDPTMKEEEFVASLKDTMKFLTDKAKAAGLDVQNPLEQVQTQGAHPDDIQAILNKHR